MAEIPRYDSRIAPPSTTGEILDTTSARLIAQKEIAKTRQWMGAANLAGAVADSASQIGDIYARKNLLSQEASRLSDEQKIRDEIVQLGSKLSQNTNLYKYWQNDAQGRPSEMMENWADTLLNEYGLELEGPHREQFELDVKDMLGKANLDIDAKATEYAYASYKGADQALTQADLNNPNIDNMGASIVEKNESFTARLDRGIDLGMYSPEMRSEAVEANRMANISSHIYAAAADIQDGTEWFSDETQQFYDGIGGSLQMVDDYVSMGLISDVQGRELSKGLLDENGAKYARGQSVQDQRNVDTWNRLRKEMVERNVRYSPEQLWAETEKTRDPEYTDVYSTRGNSSIYDDLLEYQQLIDNPKTDDEDWVPPGHMVRLWGDQSKSQDWFQKWLTNNYKGMGMPIDEYAKWMNKTKPFYSLLERTNINAALDLTYGPMIEDAGNDDEERRKWEDRKHAAHFNLLENAASEEMTSEEDMWIMLENLKKLDLEREIAYDYSRPDRGTNEAEQWALEAQRGNLRGVSTIDEDVALQISKMQVAQYDMTLNTYGFDENGNTNVLEAVEGTKNSVYEGRVTFLVKDPFDNNREKWIIYDVEEDERGNLEEVAKELPVDDQDRAIGADWDIAAAPSLRNAAQPRIIPPISDILPQPQEPLSVINEMDQWYKENSNGALIPYEHVEAYLRNNYHSPQDTQAFLENIYSTALPKLTTQLQNDDNARRLGLFRNNGSLRIGARSVIAQSLAMYGLPPTYIDRAIADVFGDN